MAETQVEKLMRLLDCTQEEALDVIEKDKIIDRGGRTEFDLDEEKEKLAKKMANVDTHKKATVYKWDKKPRKENPTKAGIIAELAQFLEKNSENVCEMVTITNKERQISFKIDENMFELTLVQKRKPKN